GEHALAALLVGCRGPHDHRPGRPWVRRRPFFGRPGHDFELVDRRRTLAVRGAQAVRTGVAAADDDHVLAGRRDRRLGEVALLDLVGTRQVLHGLVDALELAARDRQVAPLGSATGKYDRVELGPESLGGDVDAHIHAGTEHRALRLHLLDAAIEVALLHFEFGNAVAQKAADAVGALEHGH